MAYQIEYSSEAASQLKKLEKPIQRQIKKRIERISGNPELAKPLSNVFKNFRSEHIGKYRVLFAVKENFIIISKVEHRKKAYR